ncbi:hypothetical protein GH714_039797 [Hevea brasiliensis]|uniref:phosphoglycerate dehydrogenase n=1 Tax=Hevea brasiliensis TaxID=3981 RepID=A0A6A6KGT8_HEVBR|nr:hypothetical protein GH714_039797 [Hevea brasiliensis]
MGFGKVGSEVARRAKGLGMNVIAHDPYAPAEHLELIWSLSNKPFPLQISSLPHASYSTTHNLFNDDTFANMEDGVRIINVARGGSGIKSVKLVYESARDPDDLDTRLLQAMAIKGIIEPISSSFINLVNADFIAKQKSLRIREERIVVNTSPEFPVHSIQVQIFTVDSKFASAISENGNITIEGRAKYKIPHLTQLGSFGVDVRLKGNLILCRQVYQLRMIGQIGNILGDHNVNINFMSVGRTERSS